MKWAPTRPAEGRERWGVVIFAVLFMALFAAELARDFSAAKLSVPFMLAYIGPLTALHEAGHAVAAGPGAEALLAVLVTLAVGADRMLQRTDSIGVIAAQALVVLVLLDLFMNLIPLPIESERGEALTDGLGIVLSPFLPRSHFVSLMALPWDTRAERAKTVAQRIEIYREGVAALPNNPFLRLRLADELFAAGELFDARAERLHALESPDLPDALRRKLREQLGQ
jgi:hypothetical protein